MKTRLWILPNVMLPGWKRALVELEGDLPGTLEELLGLVPERLRGLLPSRPRWVVNSRWLEPAAEAEVRPRPGDEILVAGVPGEGVTLGLTIASLVISLLSTVVALATLPPKRERGEESSPTYGFGGPVSAREEGGVKPVLYGEHRMGGQVVNEGIELSASSAEDATYYVQVSLGEGPIAEIAGITEDTPRDQPITFGPSMEPPRGIRVDDVDLAELDGSEVEIRLGTNEQDPMDGFRRTGVEFVVDQDLDAIETNGQVPLVDIISVDDTQAVQDDAWEAFGVSFDLDADEYDSCRLRLSCPEGLVRYDSSGVPQPHRMGYIFRYQRLDSGGTPVTTGGNFNDGWVRPREREINVKEENPFEFSVPVPFYNPVGFSPETPGFVLRTDPQNGAHLALTSGFQNPPGWIGGTLVDELTLEGWFYPHDRGPEDVAGGPAPRGGTLIRKDPAAAGQGWELRMDLKTFTAAPGVTEQYFVPLLVVNDTTLELGELRNASGQPQVGVPVARFERFEWQHVAITYEGSPPGGQNRFRLYWNGALVWEVVGAIGLRHSIGELYVMSSSSEVAVNGQAEEVRVYQSALTPADIRASYNEGAGTYGAPSSALVAGYHFDENSGSLALDYSGNGNDLGLANGANTGFPGWVPRPGAGNTPLRSKWRVQVMRNTEDSTDSAVRDDLRWSAIEGLVDESFSYPNEPLLGIRTKASEQLSGRRPDVTSLARGRRLCPVWDGIDPAHPTYVRRYTSNPAWVALDVLLTERFGLKRYFSDSSPDVLQFQELADRSDEIVYDLRGDKRTGDQAAPLQSPHYNGILYQSLPIGEPQYAGRGQISIRFQSGAPPAHWRAGAYVAWTGEQVADGHVDTNQAEGGYEIDRIQELNGTWWVYCYWDRLDEGTPCNEGTFLHSNAGATGAYTGTIEGRDVRFRFDAVFDEPRDGWEAFSSVLRTARAVPVPLGDRIGLKVAMPRAPVFTVGQANIERGSFEVEFRSPELEPSAYVIAFADRDLDYDQSSFRLEDDTVAASAASIGAREDALDGFGMTRRMQLARHAQYLLNRRKWIDAVGRYVAPPDSLWYQPGDVIRLATDLLPWGTSGRVTEEGTATTFKLDRTVTFEAGKTYFADVRAPDLHFETGEINVAAAGGAGTYPPGITLTLTAALSFVPHAEAVATVYEEDGDFLATVTEATPREDLSVEVVFERYRSELHDDTPTEDLDDPVEQPGEPLTATGTLPPLAEALRLRPLATADSSALPVTRLAVGWTVRGAGADHVAGWRLLYRRLAGELQVRDPQGWELGADLQAGARSAVLELPRTTERGLWEVCVQSVGKDGSARRPDACARLRRWILPPVVTPPAPTGFAAVVRGERVRYSWTPVPDWPGLRYEVRRGGWVLGQVCGVSAVGASELVSDNAAGGDANSWGASDPTLYLCAKTADGRYSPPALLEAAPVKRDGTVKREDEKTATPFFSSQAWEDFGTGWQDVGTILATLTGLEIADNPERPGTKLLRFEGSNLSGSYAGAIQTVGTDVDPAWPAEEFYVEAFVEAVQDHPGTLFGGAEFADLGSLLWEGPSSTLPGGVAPCTLRLEIRILGEDGGDTWGEWRPYTPARYYGRYFRLRVVVTRPDEDHDVRILRFSQRISRVERPRFQRDDLDLLVAPT